MSVERIVYVTSSQYKRQENEIFVAKATLSDETPVRQLFSFELRETPVPKEILEVDLKVMVQAEVVSAYSQIRVPCIVEHAGLVFDDYRSKSYPGGLTKPMWDTLGDKFLDETGSSGRRAVARAVVAYCDGKSVQTFVGETSGRLADAPRGRREFYWDTVFVPNDDSGKTAGKTYAEIVEDESLGLEYKVLHLSQSTLAMKCFLEHRRTVGPPELWS